MGAVFLDSGYIAARVGDVLLVRQAYRSRWGVPGGLLQRGEAPARAAVRSGLLS